MRILLVEDDLALRTGLVDTLESEGFEVAAADGFEGQSQGHWVVDVLADWKRGVRTATRFRGRRACALLVSASRHA